MEQIDISKLKKVFFIGIGGIGISAIARMMLLEGKEVYGSDTNEGTVVDGLRLAGAHITIGQSMELIPEDVDLIVYTIAIEKYDVTLYDAVRAGAIPCHSYPEMLEIVTANKYTIAVSGTHGKTTTTAMIGHILRGVGSDPSMIVGSLMVGDRSNFWAGESDLFVVEACEYRRSFLHIHPKILVITNIEEDHLDYYKDLEDIKSAFREMATRVPTDGYVVCDPTNPTVSDVVRGISAHVIDHTTYMTHRSLIVPGAHNQIDASLAVATVAQCGVSVDDATKVVATFPGTWRRFEYKGLIRDGAKWYDDYAHHPTEIRAALAGARELYPVGQNRITVVFQPHLYSRTRTLFAEFATAFARADEVILLPIYAAREVDDGTMSSEILAQAVREHGVSVRAMSFAEAAEYLKTTNLTPADVVITMGAGEAYKVLA